MHEREVENLAINTIRTLAMDAVEKAKSGHPGAPMALAPVAYYLFQNILQFDPSDAYWPNRDRFVLSNGHASMLLYALLHLYGVKDKKSDRLAITLEDIKSFRQINSPCAGHPEYGFAPGIETTTGPLAQGLGNSVGMAIAEQWLRNRYNKPGFPLFSHSIYAFCGDGCLMEGLSSEAASLAGHLGLGHLCWIFDSNNITIEGHTDLAISEDVAKRFMAYGWQVTHVLDANDQKALKKAFEQFGQESDRPTLIIVNSHIAYGSPHKQDTAHAHGSPLGAEEVRLTKRFYGWPEEAQFLIPPEVVSHMQVGVKQRMAQKKAEWERLYDAYKKEYPQLAQELSLIEERKIPKGALDYLPEFKADAKGLATRKSSQIVFQEIAKRVPWMIGGSADLAPSTFTLIADEASLQKNSRDGRNMHFGIREHAMAAAANGMAVYGLRPFVSTFLIFSDYMRPALRLSSIMDLPVIYIFTHDSIGVGEDGPTHQPIEQLASLRAMPGLINLRPADANEVAACWRIIMSTTNHPLTLSLSRQDVPTLDRARYASATGVQKGAYVIAGFNHENPKVVLMASGSEVHLCVQAYEELLKMGIEGRVISMPCMEIFSKQEQSYRDDVLKPKVLARVFVEQASAYGLEKYVGEKGAIIAMNSFGASAPVSVLQEHFGFTTKKVVEAALSQIHLHGGK